MFEIIGTLCPEEKAQLGVDKWCAKGKVIVWINSDGVVRAAILNKTNADLLEEEVGRESNFRLPDRIHIAAV